LGGLVWVLDLDEGAASGDARESEAVAEENDAQIVPHVEQTKPANRIKRRQGGETTQWC
jgi:hypothetical protein